MPKPIPIQRAGARVVTKLPSRFQVGDTVHVVGTVTAVAFGEGQVNYDVIVGTHAELPPQPIVSVRSYDVYPRALQQDPQTSEPTI